MLKIKLISGVFLVLSACGQKAATPVSVNSGVAEETVQSGVPSENPSIYKILIVKNNFSNHVWQQLNYTVTGAGELQMTATPNSGSTEILIRVSHYRYKAENVTLSLKPSDNPELYKLLVSILDGNSRIGAAPKSNRLGGSFKHVTLYHPAVGTSLIYDEPLVNGSGFVFNLLYAFVTKHL